MTDTPEIPTFELTYEWPVVIILGSGERLNLSTLDNTDYGDAARKMKELVEQLRSDDPPEWIECAGAASAGAGFRVRHREQKAVSAAASSSDWVT